VKTIQELKDERARQLTIMEDAVRATRDAGLTTMTDDDRLRFDGAKSALEAVNAEITEAEKVAGDAVRMDGLDEIKRSFSVPNINVKGDRAPGSDVTRNLDELLWATAEKVDAGQFGRDGAFRSSGATNSVEQVILRNEDSGQAVQAPRISAFRPDDRHVIRQFQGLVADMSIFGMMIDNKARTSADGFQVARSHRLFKDQYRQILRALDTDTSSEGTEWIPTGIGASLHEKVRAAGKVAALFPRVNLPSNPWKWPLEGADATAYRVAEPTSDTATKVTASTPGTAAATFDAEILGGRILFSKSLEADSALAILPFTQMKLVRAFVDAEEKAILDGDSDGTHQDADTQAVGATHASSSWDGLRKRALAETTQATTTTSAANLALIRKSMGKWGVNPSDLAYIVGVSSYLVLLSDSNLLTVDKFGPSATILNGQVGSLYGIPVIVSEHVRENLNASGVHDAITTTKTYALCVNRNEWAMGQRTPLMVETDDSIYRETYQRVVVGFMREDFQSIAAVSTDDTTSIGYNITSGS
jgi:HK97 family phage major capsid protein